MRAALTLLYAPAMLLGFNGLAIALVAGRAPLWLLAPLLVAAIGASFLAERLAPYQPDWNHDHHDRGRDVSHALVNEASNSLALGLIPLLTLISPFKALWPANLPLALQLLLAILVADAGITLTHYASHKISWLWRFHAVHHSARRLYGLNGLMKHPVHQAVETSMGVAPLILVGLPLNVGALLAFAVAIQLLLQHSNVDMRIGPLRRVLALAPVHRFHHQSSARLGNVNFGLFTTIWDHLLGTAVFDDQRRFASRDLGIEERPDYPSGYVRQLVEPFHPQTAVQETRDPDAKRGFDNA